MDFIKDQKDLAKLLKLCRSQGVTEIKLGLLELKFGDLPIGELRAQPESNIVSSENPYANFPDGILTPEQLAFYSSGGSPDDDPALQGSIEQ